jgi:hypothetical protein
VLCHHITSSSSSTIAHSIQELISVPRIQLLGDLATRTRCRCKFAESAWSADLKRYKASLLLESPRLTIISAVGLYSTIRYPLEGLFRPANIVFFFGVTSTNQPSSKYSMVGSEDLAICVACGTQFDVSISNPPKACKICDVRSPAVHEELTSSYSQPSRIHVSLSLHLASHGPASHKCEENIRTPSSRTPRTHEYIPS